MSKIAAHLLLILSLLLPLGDLYADECQLPKTETPITPASSDSSNVGGHVLSWTMTGAGYAAEYSVKIGYGIVLGATLCLPLLVSPEEFRRCVDQFYPFQYSFDSLKNITWGKEIYSQTRYMRCPSPL